MGEAQVRPGGQAELDPQPIPQARDAGWPGKLARIVKRLGLSLRLRSPRGSG